MEPTKFAWTAHEIFPAYINLTGNRLTVRSPMHDGILGPEVGRTAAIDLPPDVAKALFGWRDAVIEAAVTNWTYTAADENDPKGAVDRLLVNAIDQERDELRDRIATLTRERDEALALLAEITPPRLIGESHAPYPEGKTTVLMSWDWLRRVRAIERGEAG